MFLQISHLQKSYHNTPVLRDVSFSLDAGQTLAILGRSGCGKTTLLKILAGLIPGTGRIEMAGKRVDHLLPQDREIVYLYQETLLFPHLNVFENIAFGLRLRRIPEADITSRVGEMLRYLDLEPHADKMPESMSGGQKQRVSFGRALIIRPRLLLLDEPFGNLDVETRALMQDFFRKTAAEQEITAIFVTHDLKEAIRMGDRWGFMHDGNLRQYDSLQAFTNDDTTGVQQEIAFWKSVSS